MNSIPVKKIIIAYPHGFCAGVVRAVQTAEKALERYGKPVYCLNELVHNELVVRDLRSKGIKFVKHISEIPESSVVILSAHGVPPSVKQMAADRKLVVLDATCPFVEKIHSKVKQFSAKGYNIFVIGHHSHAEIVGITGEAPANIKVLCSVEEAKTIQPITNNRLSTVVTQTTLSVTEANKIISILKKRFPYITTQNTKDICYATENRQKAVQLLCGKSDLIIILGSKKSSNTRRLQEIAEDNTSAPVVMVSSMNDLKKLDLTGKTSIGLTAGASTPETFVEEILDALGQSGFTRREKLEAAKEKVSLKLPPNL